MQRAVEHVVDAAQFDDLSGIGRRHAIRHFRRQREVVADEDDAEAEPRLHLLEHVDDGALRQDVERGGRLVEDHDLRVEQHAERQQRALAHPAAQFVRIGIEDALRVEPHQLEQFQRALLDRSLGLLLPCAAAVSMNWSRMRRTGLKAFCAP